MNNIIISKVIGNLVENDALPAIEFTDSIMLSKLIDNITVASNVMAGETPDVYSQRWLGEFFNNTDSNLKGEIDKIVTLLSNGMDKAVTTLKNIHSIVQGLTKKIDTDSDKAISLNPKLANFLDKKQIEVDYPEVQYSILNAVGDSKIVVDNILAVVGNTDPLSMTTYDSVIERYIQMCGLANISDFTVTDDDYEKIVTKVGDEVKTDIDVVRDVFKILMNKNKITTLVNVCKRNVSKSSDYTKQYFDALSIIDKFLPTVINLEKELLSMNYDTESITSNVKVIHAVMEVYLYFVYFHRNTTFSGTILFKNGYLNTDLVEQAKEQNVSVEDVAKYVSVILGGVIVLGSGVQLKSVATTKDNVIEKFNKDYAKDELYTKLEMNKIQQRLFIKHVGEYLQGVAPDEYNLNYLQTKAGELVSNNTPIEDIIYGILINKEHKGTIVQIIHKRMGIAIKDAIANNNDITKEEIAEVKTEVYVDILTDILGKYLV